MDKNFNFRKTLLLAKNKDPSSILSIISQYQLLINNMSLDEHGVWDDDLHQEIIETVLHCIYLFNILD